MRWGHNQESTRIVKLKNAVSHVLYKDNSTPWWYVCMFVYVCVCVCVCTRVRVCMYMCVCACVLVRARAYVCMYVCMGEEEYSCTHSYPNTRWKWAFNFMLLLLCIQWNSPQYRLVCWVGSVPSLESLATVKIMITIFIWKLTSQSL